MDGTDNLNVLNVLATTIRKASTQPFGFAKNNE